MLNDSSPPSTTPRLAETAATKHLSPEYSEMEKESVSGEANAPSDITNIEPGQISPVVKPKVKFNLLAAIGVQYSITGAPVAIGTYLSLVVGLGGSPAYFWGYILTGFFQFAVALAAAELASAIPHSSGPAHWVTVLAPPRFSRIMGYIIGWSTNAGWFFVCSATALYAAQLIMALVAAANPDFTPRSWQTYLVYAADTILCFMINLPRVFKTVNYLLIAVIFTLNGTAIWLLVSLLVKAHPKQSAYIVFVKFVNESGWKSDGWVFFLALLPAMSCMGAMDNATHLTDEVANPKKQIPQFCNVDPQSLLESVGGQPMIQLLLNAFHSVPLTIVTGTIIIYTFVVATAASLISWSRLYWSFSREGALPFSGTMQRLTSRDNLPIHALCWNTLLILAIGAISIGSATAMNAILGAATVCLLIGLIFSFCLALYKGRRSLDPERWLDLGRWGDVVFWVAALWSTFMLVVLNMPLYLPVTPLYMNWTCVVCGGVVVLATAYYLAVFSKQKVAARLEHGEDGRCEHAPEEDVIRIERDH
ncbi:hypothetical protein CLAIMM_04241 [Cladophialophora immunda]|nr:hypothetical protein CLAIMM_04241 [Cladophialophora immunda]